MTELWLVIKTVAVLGGFGALVFMAWCMVFQDVIVREPRTGWDLELEALRRNGLPVVPVMDPRTHNSG